MSSAGHQPACAESITSLHVSRRHTSNWKRNSLLLLGLTALGVLAFSRCPDLLLVPRFFAEDGTVFYQQAHSLGFVHSVFIPYAGYFHLFPRLIAGLSLWIPLLYVPLLFNFAALAVQLLTATYICSPRMQNIGPFRGRVLVALLYLGLPHIDEVWGKLTNAQWHIAVLSFLILISIPPQSRLGTWFDRVALAVGALTGPFCIVLLPIALVVVIWRRSSRTLIHLAILCTGAAVQAFPLIMKGRPAENANLGASFALLCKLLVRWLFLGFLPDGAPAPQWLRHVGESWEFRVCLLMVAVAVVSWIVLKANLELRCALLFGVLVAAASLASPIVTTGGEQWPTMLATGAGERYWFLPRLILAVTILWLAVQRLSKWIRIASVAAMLGILFCSVAGWPTAPWKGTRFHTYVHVFNALPIGAQLRIPIDPPPAWALQLTKEPFDRTSHNPGFTGDNFWEVTKWRTQFPVASVGETPSSLVGEVLWVNGTPTVTREGAKPFLRVPIRDGALLEGWAVLPTHGAFKRMDKVYAIVSDHVVEGVRLPLALGYRGNRLENAMYLVFLPSGILHHGLQEVKTVGYAEGDKVLRSCGVSLYIFGE